MSGLLRRLLAPHREIVANSASLVGAAAATSGLGYLYWALAARQLPAEAVGLAAALVSAMLLMATVGVFGLETLVIGELPRWRGREWSLVSTAAALAGLIAAVLGGGFALVAPWVSGELAVLAGSAGLVALFVVGAGLTAVALVLDHALIGLLRGQVQLGRNVLFAAGKLAGLAAASLWLADRSAMSVLATWVVGLFGSLLLVVWQAGHDSGRLDPPWPRPRMLGGLCPAALAHHALNLALKVPTLALPLLVTAMLSAAANAYFYVAWSVALLVFWGPMALTTVLFAAGVRSPDGLVSKVRFTLGLGMAGGVAANVALLAGAGSLLAVFGADYAQQSRWTVCVLALGVFPLVVKDHYVAVRRIEGRIGEAALAVALGGAVELVCVAIGASTAGLLGLSAGWVVGLCVETAWMAPAVHRAATRGPSVVAVEVAAVSPGRGEVAA